MRYSISLAVIVVCGANIPLFAQPAAPPTSAEEPAASSDEDSIRKVVVSYADAFNAGDAKKLASHWTEEGELATPNGAVIKGREALVETFTKYFEEKVTNKVIFCVM